MAVRDPAYSLPMLGLVVVVVVVVVVVCLGFRGCRKSNYLDHEAHTQN